MSHKTLTSALAATIRSNDAHVGSIHDRVTTLALADVAHQLDLDRLRAMPPAEARALLADVGCVLAALEAALRAERTLALVTGRTRRAQ